MELSRKLTNSYNPETVDAPTRGHVIWYQDGMMPYLKLKVTDCSRSWYFDAGFGGKHVKRRIGSASTISCAEARIKAFDWKRSLENGEVPPTAKARVQKVRQATETVRALYEQYYDQHLKTTSDHKWSYRAYELYWGPIRDIAAASLTPQIVSKWLNQLTERISPASANRQRTNLKACLRWAGRHNLIDPAIPERVFALVKAFPEAERVAYLREEQVAPLKEALAQETQDINDAIMLHLCTGQRRSNVLSMRWDELDLANNLWIIPKSKTKTKRTYFVALSEGAKGIITRRREGNTSEFVFPSRRKSKRGHLYSIQKAWGRVRRKAELGGLRVHDLRHTVGTWLAQSGATPFQIQTALNHADVATSQRYVHLVANDVRSLLNSTQEKLG